MNILELLGISTLNLYIWIAFGIVVGIVAHLNDNRRAKGGVISTSIFAIIGSVVGGFLASFLLAKTMIEFSIEGLITALFSALILAIFYRASFRNTGNIRIHKI